jgi:hypothetical protein
VQRSRRQYLREVNSLFKELCQFFAELERHKLPKPFVAFVAAKGAHTPTYTYQAVLCIRLLWHPLPGLGSPSLTFPFMIPGGEDYGQLCWIRSDGRSKQCVIDHYDTPQSTIYEALGRLGLNRSLRHVHPDRLKNMAGKCYTMKQALKLGLYHTAPVSEPAP